MLIKNETPNHPGLYIKNHVIPVEMTVTQAAKNIGVGRSAVSKLLNGNAKLSSEMATKIEKAFGASACDLLAMQSAFDAGTSAVTTNTTSVRTFVPAFAAPKANDLEHWADTTLEARANLAALMRILVHSTCDGLQDVDFPAHDDSQRPGSDGKVEAKIGNPWVPIGNSVWEFGVTGRIKDKADVDFAKSVKATPKKQRMEMTFIFVTPRRWIGKGAWRDEHAAKNQWKDVKVFDSSDLEQWMEQSIPAQVWFANERGGEHRGTKSLDRCWVTWNADCDPKFTTNIFDEAAIVQGKKLLEHLRSSDRTLRIGADSILEGLAFVYATLCGDDPNLSALRDSIVVFTEKGPLTELVSKISRFIPIVTNPETEVELSETGVRLGGISIVLRTMVQTEADLVLDTLSGEAFSKALETMGLGRDAIKRLEDESGRSLTVLRRRLAQDHAIKSPAWSTDTTLARSVFPFMLAGTWKSDNEADRIILSFLADPENYADVERGFAELLPIESAPVWSIGSFRGVVSKIDALYALHSSVTEEDLNRFYDVADLVLSERDPSLDLPEEDRWAAGIYDKVRSNSAALRAGIADSLVILSMHGNNLFKKRLGIDTQHKANAFVRKLLDNMDGDTMVSQSDELQRYAEAAPEEFLNIVERDLQKNDPATQALMRPVGDSFFSRNPRVGLLWALDLLAWSPKFLQRVVKLLAQLSELEPKDRSGNSAMQSLLSIFRSWMPQTSASVDQRIAAFNQLVKKYPEIAWAIGRDQYNEMTSRTASPSVKPKWRGYTLGSGDYAPDDERWKFDIHCVETALAWQPMNKEKLSDLIYSLDSLEIFDGSYRDRVWQRVSDWAKSASDEEQSWLRENILVWVSRRARFLIRKRASEAEINVKVSEARDIYDELEPEDIVWKYAWLFKSKWVEHLWEDIHENEHDFCAKELRVAAQREAAVRAVNEDEGFSGIVRLALSGNAPHVVGGNLEKILTSETERLAFTKLIIGRPELLTCVKLQDLLDGFFCTLDAEQSVALIDKLRVEVNDDQLVRMLCLCLFCGDVWDAVEGSSKKVAERYWHEVTARRSLKSEEELRYAVTKLIEVGRGLTALHLAHLDLKSIESEQLYKILQTVRKSNEGEDSVSSMDGDAIKEIFKALNSRGKIERSKMAALEFLYLGVLRHDRGSIPNLETEVNYNPSLFCEAISIACRSELEPPDKELTKEQKQAAKFANTFISALSSVPGVDNKGAIQANMLKQWIAEARRICDETDHKPMLDYKIGEILAKAPAAEDGTWPCEPVREAIEDVYSLELEQGFTFGRYNACGAVFRGEGGGQERGLAEQYENWAKACEFEYPWMAKILRELVKKYLADVELYDNEAMIRRRMLY